MDLKSTFSKVSWSFGMKLIEEQGYNLLIDRDYKLVNIEYAKYVLFLIEEGCIYIFLR